MKITVRKMRIEDASGVTALSHELGYPLTVEQVTGNIGAVINSIERIAFVATYNNEIVGWTSASQSIAIVVIPQCEINGLVVSKIFQGKGIGKKLIEAVKEWAKERGNNKVSLRCNVKRIEAHQFYQHLGFKDIKKQTNFVIDI